jgi:glycosyltransferase involved in cell wall biosynthesis
MRPLRVAVVAACPFPYPRGTPVRALRLSESVAALGHDVHVATYHLGQGPVDPRLSLARIRAPRWIRPEEPGPSVGKVAVLDPLLVRTFRRLLKRRGPFDVIHAHHYEGLVVALAARPRNGHRVPVVYDAHTLLETELPTYGGRATGGLRARWGRRADHLLPPRADHVVTVSGVLRDRLLASGRLAPTAVTTVGNGLEPEAFVRDPRRPPPADGGVVVYAGNLAPYHRVDLLLEAFARLLRTRPRARLAIYTESAPDAVRSQARALGLGDRLEVRALGFPAVAAALARAHVAVNPRPVCDGVPQKNLNYMAAGLPLVAFRGSFHPYRDPDSGVAVEAVEPGALAAALDDLLARPVEAARMGAAARSRAEAELSWWATGRRVVDVYRALLAPDGDAPARSGRG